MVQSDHPTLTLGLIWDSQVVRQVVKPRTAANIINKKHDIFGIFIYNIGFCVVKIMKVVVLSKKSCLIFYVGLIYGHVKRHTHQPYELSAYLFIGETWMKYLFMSQLDSTLCYSRNNCCEIWNNAKTFEITSEWCHVVNNYSKFQISFSPKLEFSEKRRADS